MILGSDGLRVLAFYCGAIRFSEANVGRRTSPLCSYISLRLSSQLSDVCCLLEPLVRLPDFFYVHLRTNIKAFTSHSRHEFKDQWSPILYTVLFFQNSLRAHPFNSNSKLFCYAHSTIYIRHVPKHIMYQLIPE